jgi:hypothetical protein
MRCIYVINIDQNAINTIQKLIIIKVIDIYKINIFMKFFLQLPQYKSNEGAVVAKTMSLS